MPYLLWYRVKQMDGLCLRRVLFSVIVLVVVIAALKLGFIHRNSSPIDKVTAHIQTQINTTTPHQQNANTKLRLETQNVYLG